MRNLSSDGRFNTNSWNCRKLVAEQLLRGTLPSQYPAITAPSPSPPPQLRRTAGQDARPRQHSMRPYLIAHAMCTVQRTLALDSERTLMKD